VAGAVEGAVGQIVLDARRKERQSRVWAAVEEEAEPTSDAATGSHVALAVRQQHDLAEHSAFAQHLVRAARLLERQSLRDQGLDLALFEQVQQR
jgi:hypothetical protein